MAHKSERRVVVLTRPTRLEDLLARCNTAAQARFLVESRGGDFSDYQDEHEVYHDSLRRTRDAVDRVALLQVLPRAYLPNFVFGRDDVVVAVGQDGLVANLLKYTDGQPVLGVNPDPGRWDGPLLPFAPGNVEGGLSSTLENGSPIQQVSMAEVTLSDGQSLTAVNDFFIGPRTHTSARYRITLGDASEVQSSSGLLVSTGLGSGAWMKSVVTGSLAVAARMGTAAPKRVEWNLPWDSRDLLFAVREPFPTRTTAATLVYGTIADGGALVLESHMAEHGVIFSDGIEQDYIPFVAGTRATVRLSPRRGLLVRPKATP